MKTIPLVPPASETVEAADTTSEGSRPAPGADDVSTVVPDPVIVDAAGIAGIRMTLTAPGCPAAQSLPVEVAEKVRKVPGVADARVEVVWEPGWTKDRMSEAAKLQLGLW